jgi:hypothetical protein
LSFQPQIDTEGSKYTLFLLISGGIGVTPLQSVCNQLVDQRARGRPLDLCWFIWSCRDKGLGNEMAEAMVQQWDESIPAAPCEHATSDKSEDDDVGYSCWAPSLPAFFSQGVDETVAPPGPQPSLRRRCPNSGLVSDASAKRLPPGQSFQPNNLEVLSKSATVATKLEELNANSHGFVDLDFLHTEMFLTGTKNQSDLEDADIGPTADLFTFGRPDFKRTFAAMASIAKDKGRTHVAVLACGPQSLIKAVASECLSMSASTQIQFDCHIETFEL